MMKTLDRKYSEKQMKRRRGQNGRIKHAQNDSVKKAVLFKGVSHLL